MSKKNNNDLNFQSNKFKCKLNQAIILSERMINLFVEIILR